MTIRIDEFISTGVGKLEKKFMGGVSTESAQRAISETARAVEEEMSRVSRLNIEQINSKNFQAMKDLGNNYIAQLNQKDREMLSLSSSKSELESEKQNILTKLEKLIARIEKASQYKEIETLPDGSKVFEKIGSHLHAKATKTVNKDGKTTQINIEAGKTFRRTTYNPETEKPLFRITNATKDGRTIKITYDNYGNIKRIETLNAKKVKAPAPTVLNRETVENNDYHIVTRANMSDGSILTTKTERSNGKVYYWDLKPSKDHWPTEWYDRDTRSGIVRRGSFDKTTITYPNGIKWIDGYSKTIDKNTGIKIRTSRINFPKGAPVKRIDIKTMEGSSDPYMNIVSMNNGDKVELTDFKFESINPVLTARRPHNKILFPQKAVIIKKDGTRTEMPNDEIRSWIEAFHPGYNDSVTTKRYGK